MMTPVEPLESRDEVDFIMTAAAHNNNNDYEDFSSASVAVISAKATAAAVDKPEATTTATTTTTTTATVTPNIEPNSNQNSLKKSKERRTLFSFGSKKSSSNTSSKSQVEAGSAPVTSSCLLLPPTPPVPIGTPPRQHKFVKSNSIARLLGNTYNARKFEREEQKRLANEASGKFHTFSGRRRGSGPYLERFKRMSKEDGDIATNGNDENSAQVSNVMTLTTDSRDLQYGSRQEHVGRAEDQLSAKAMRTLTRSLGKLWWKRTHSVDISTPDPEYKVSYLGNVLTGWAKGELDLNAIYS